MICPKCSFDQPDGRIDCVRCGIVFRKFQESLGEPSRGIPAARLPAIEEEEVGNGRIGAAELKSLGLGLVLALIVFAIPFTRFVFAAMVTLFHELGHAIIGWLLGVPSLPAFDFVYGGGFTHQSGFHLSVALVVAGLFLWAGWLFRENRTSVALIVGAFLVWIAFVSGEWRRELAIASAGHAFEFILAGILFYQALSGVGWRIPEIERPLGAFIAFFVQIHSMAFAWRLLKDPGFLAWYREGKGGALMNDLEVVALDLHIFTPFNPGIQGVARMLLWFSLFPFLVGLVWYLQRARWHRVMRALRTASV